MSPEDQQKFAALERRLSVAERTLKQVHMHLFPRARDSDTGSGEIELVAIATDGGTGGDESTPCNYTYAFTDSTAAAHTFVAPAQNRLPQALDATFGLWDLDNERLIALDEWPDGGGC